MTRTTLGELQHAIMKILWERDEATSADIHAALLPSRGLAPTTISTMLRKMEDKGVVDHRLEGRQYVFRPLVSEPEVQRSMVDELVDRLFGGDPAALVSHLVTDHGLEPGELAHLQRLLEHSSEEEAS